MGTIDTNEKPEVSFCARSIQTDLCGADEIAINVRGETAGFFVEKIAGVVQCRRALGPPVFHCMMKRRPAKR